MTAEASDATMAVFLDLENIALGARAVAVVHILCCISFA